MQQAAFMIFFSHFYQTPNNQSLIFHTYIWQRTIVEEQTGGIVHQPIGTGLMAVAVAVAAPHPPPPQLWPPAEVEVEVGMGG